MYCSNCGAKVDGNFCANCGTKIKVDVQQASLFSNQDEVFVKPQAKATKAVPTILTRSKSCMPVLEKKRNRFFIIQWVSLGLEVIFIPILIYLISYWGSIWGKTFLSDILPYVSIFVLAITVSFIIGIVVFFKQTKAINNFYMRYRFYASTEVLIVEDRKITGSTTKGPLKLAYDQIRSVTSLPSAPSSRSLKALKFSNTILKIRDVAGKEFVFYSFTNCEELKTVIDWRCSGEQDD